MEKVDYSNKDKLFNILMCELSQKKPDLAVLQSLADEWVELDSKQFPDKVHERKKEFQELLKKYK